MSASISYGAMVEGLVNQGVPLARAESRAREEYPDVARELDAATAKRANVREKDEQRVIRKMAIALGFKVYWLSQAERSGQTPGLGDLWLVHRARKVALWWEAKRQVGGKRSTVQEEFAEECTECGIGYGFGDRYEFARWLSANGFPPIPIPQD